MSLTTSNGAPTVKDIQPSGPLSNEPTQVEVTVDDPDFADGGDEVDVTVDVDGSQITQQTITSNTTITASMPSSGQTGGEHTIDVEATDAYSQTTTDSETYKVPDTLFVREENNHTALVPADGEVRFFGDEEVFSRSAPDGKVNMTNLPVDQDFIVEVQPTDENYTSRTVYIEGIYDQQSVYVLNTSAVDITESRFILNDPTGNYDSQSLLKIQKPINVSGSLTYQTIVSDEFGVEGITATLEQGQRYRLQVGSGDTQQIVGPYRAAINETVEVEPGTPTIELSFEDSNWAADATLENDTLEYRYQDQENLTTELTIWIHERNNQSNKLTANQSFQDPVDVSGIETLNANQTEKEWVVNFVVDRDGETFVRSVLVTNRADLTLPIDAGWTSMIGVGLLILFAGAFSMLNAGIGAVLVSLMGGLLWFIGFLGGATSAAAIVIALFISVLGHVYNTTR